VTDVPTAQATRRGIPQASVARLPGYLRALTELSRQDVANVSSEELAAAAGVSSAMLRKDLSHLGSYGVRGVGYDVERLASEIATALGLSQEWPVGIVGMGNLGRALAAYRGFAQRGFEVIALLDGDPRIVGERVAGQEILGMDALPGLVSERGLAIGVIATPSEGAQDACDRLVAAGVRSILTFAPTVLTVPEGVVVRSVDVATELQILAFHGHRDALAEVVAR
jgi:redox-sensing transcriptional repressor